MRRAVERSGCVVTMLDTQVGGSTSVLVRVSAGVRDYRDSVIEAFAVSEADLFERLRTAEGERDTWRLIAVQALHRCAEQEQARVREVDRQRGRMLALIAELHEARGTRSLRDRRTSLERP